MRKLCAAHRRPGSTRSSCLLPRPSQGVRRALSQHCAAIQRFSFFNGQRRRAISSLLGSLYANCAFLAGVGLLFGCAEIAGRADDNAALPKQLRTRQIVVTLANFRAPDSHAIAQALSSRHRLHEAGTFPLEAIGVECVVFDVPPVRRLDEVIKELRDDPRVESVQLNSMFDEAQAPHNDPYARLEYGAAAIHADAAHRISTGKGIRVAVVDTGADVDHPDLRGGIAKVANFVDRGEVSFATDRHGTAVAGLIAARADNAIGMFGVAPDAELLLAKACWYGERSGTKARCSSWTLAKAIDFAIREHSRVLNLSLTGPDDALLERLLVAAEAREVIVVAAAARGGRGFRVSGRHAIGHRRHSER